MALINNFSVLNSGGSGNYSRTHTEDNDVSVSNSNSWNQRRGNHGSHGSDYGKKRRRGGKKH